MALKFSIDRGIAQDFEYQHVDSTGAPKSLVGCTIYFTVKDAVEDDSLDDSTAIIKKTITNHVDQTGTPSAASGVSFFSISDSEAYYSQADHTPIPVGKYYWDIIVENPSGRSEPPSLYGSFDIKGHPSNRQVVNG